MDTGAEISVIPPSALDRKHRKDSFSLTGRAYLGGSAEPSLADIHQEMSELLDKQVNAQNRKLPGFMQAPASPRKTNH